MKMAGEDDLSKPLSPEPPAKLVVQVHADAVGDHADTAEAAPVSPGGGGGGGGGSVGGGAPQGDAQTFDEALRAINEFGFGQFLNHAAISAVTYIPSGAAYRCSLQPARA